MAEGQNPQGDFQYIKLPDGSYGKFAATADDATIRAAVEKDFPDAYKPQPQQEPPPTGLIGGLQEGFDKLTKSTPYSMDKGVMGNIGNAFANIGGGVMSMASPLVHPRKLAESMVPKTGVEKAASMLGPGALPMLHAGEGLMDTIKKKPGEDWGQYGGRVGGQATTGVGAVLGAKGLGEAGGAVADFTDPIKAYRSPLIPPEEATARAAADVLRPNPMDYRSTVDTLKDNLPYIKAQSPGGRFKSPIEFAKAAGNAGKEHSDFFRNQLIEPNRSHGEVGPSYDELQTINDKLRPIYKARSMGEQMTKESQDNMAALEARRDSLNDYLYRELSARSGLPEEQIRGINQRGGSLQHVGDITDSAQAMRRAGFSGYTPTGLPIPMTSMERAMRLVKALRGGPEASAGRQLSRIAKGVDGEPEALPNTDTIGAYRKMSDTDELSHLRLRIEQADQNGANSRMRTATREPSPLVTRRIQRLREGLK